MIAIYTRQSVDKKDSISIETQIEFCKREILNEDFKLYDKDKGYSGGNINRPDFQQLMKDVKDGLITKIVVYRLDRISRSILNFTSMMEVFNKHNVEFVSCTEKLDTTTPAGRMVVNILVVFAQYERESTQQRIKDNYYERAKRGVFLGGNVPYGYNSTTTKLENKKTSMLIPNEEQSLIVQSIYDMYTNKNMSLSKISRYFNEKNMLIGKSGICSSHTISSILRNPAYVKADINVYHFLDIKGCQIINDIEDFNGHNGLICYGEGNTKFKDIAGYNISVGLHKGIISAELWLKTQYKIYNNKQIANNGTSKNTWLSGIAKCGYCGYAMTFKRDTPKPYNNFIKEYKYLRCSGRNAKGCPEKMPSWYLEDAESAVLELLKKHIENNQIKTKKGTEDEKISGIKLELMSIDKKIDNLINSLMEANNVSMAYINSAINQLHQQKKELTDKIIDFEDNKSTDTIIKTKDFFINWDNLDVEEKKEIARTYINEIKLFKNKMININFKNL